MRTASTVRAVARVEHDARRADDRARAARGEQPIAADARGLAAFDGETAVGRALEGAGRGAVEHVGDRLLERRRGDAR
jgi:hypothetical protein